ncbi:MAG TPA: hypothetical protein VEQ61_09095 [Thermoleophilaceae bacterium]|nr:hypothetical protein [Thermoleophilaceae bacterium]
MTPRLASERKQVARRAVAGQLHDSRLEQKAGLAEEAPGGAAGSPRNKRVDQPMLGQPAGCLESRVLQPAALPQLVRRWGDEGEVDVRARGRRAGRQ